jgi:hypothetical protein
MKIMKSWIAAITIMGLLPLALAETPAAPPLAPADAKTHVGETASVCGKVVEVKVGKYGLVGRGKVVTFYLDQPEASQVFNFVTFGSKEGGPQEAVTAYQDKSVCVTGKITETGGVPFIMAADRTQIKIREQKVSK